MSATWELTSSRLYEKRTETFTDQVRLPSCCFENLSLTMRQLDISLCELNSVMDAPMTRLHLMAQVSEPLRWRAICTSIIKS
jgi:hypothetical protein